ncbi:MAG: hypothetical protein V3R85_12280, partial [Alphaproteobacteria bacterium]
MAPRVQCRKYHDHQEKPTHDKESAFNSGEFSNESHCNRHETVGGSIHGSPQSSSLPLLIANCVLRGTALDDDVSTPLIPFRTIPRNQRT